MTKIYPLRGMRYSVERFGKDLTDLVTEPYDKITPEMQDVYYRRHPNNLVRIELGKQFPNDDEYYNRYTRAAGYLTCWLEERIMVIDEKPAIYAYHQEFNVADEKVVRKGFIALLELEPVGKGVKAHEKTLAGPKADRLNLTRHIRGQIGHIFMLYSDPQRTIDSALDAITSRRKPDFYANDWDGNLHSVWAISDPQIIDLVKNTMADKTLFIADGHHRYETAVNYWSECEAKGMKCEPGATETFRNQIMTFINMDSPGLVILPTHRVIYSVPNYDTKRLLKNLVENFDIEEFSRSELIDKSGFEQAYKKLIEYGKQGKHSFLMMPRDVISYYLLTLKDEQIMNKISFPESHSDVWKKLDVVILHKLILEDNLGIDAKALEEKRNIHYIRLKEEGFDYLKNDRDVQVIFYMNPTKIEQVRQIADRGERMPQKSTDFYPKLLSGLVSHKFRFAE